MHGLRTIIVAAAAALLAGCGGYSGPFGSSCKRTSEVEAPPRVPPAPAHPDFEKLRAYRHYFSLGAVGEFAHHFAVYYDCIEPSVDYYAVNDAGDVALTAGYWGGMAVRDGDVPAVPDEVATQAAAARAALDREYDGHSNVRVVYLGSHRTIVVNELIPLGPPGSPYERLVNHGAVTLEANRELTEIEPTPASFEGGITRLCWKDTDYRDCTQQYWIDFDVASPIEVRVTPAIADARSPASEADRERFARAVLAAVSARDRGEPSVTIDELLAREADTLLPAGFTSPIGASFSLFARPANHGDTEQLGGGVGVSIDAAEVLFGAGAEASATTRLAGVSITARVRMDAITPVVRDAVGEQHVDVRVRYVLSDDRGNAREAEVVVDAWVIVDAGAAAVIELKAPDSFWQSNHEPPRGQSLPGVGPYSEIDAYLDFSTGRRDWIAP